MISPALSTPSQLEETADALRARIEEREMEQQKDDLYLKWGTLKGWDLHSEKAKAAVKRYLETGEQSLSAMAQRDTAEQKAALCELIDAIDGRIINDWSGEVMTKEEAKRYVMEYGNR